MSKNYKTGRKFLERMGVFSMENSDKIKVFDSKDKDFLNFIKILD